jgi:hypothetical protein
MFAALTLGYAKVHPEKKDFAKFARLADYELLLFPSPQQLVTATSLRCGAPALATYHIQNTVDMSYDRREASQ